MDASSLVALLSLTITNIVALCISHTRQKRYSKNNYGVKNGRGDLYKQVGELRDILYKETQLLTSDVAELRGMMRIYLQESLKKH